MIDQILQILEKPHSTYDLLIELQDKVGRKVATSNLLLSQATRPI